MSCCDLQILDGDKLHRIGGGLAVVFTVSRFRHGSLFLASLLPFKKRNASRICECWLSQMTGDPMSAYRAKPEVTCPPSKRRF
jgi:hypothetical protein